MTVEATRYAVELYGLPALLAGQRRIEIDAAVETLGDLARALLQACPQLAGPVIDPKLGWLQRGYVFVVNARFTREPTTPLSPGSEVLLVAAQAGG